MAHGHHSLSSHSHSFGHSHLSHHSHHSHHTHHSHHSHHSHQSHHNASNSNFHSASHNFNHLKGQFSIFPNNGYGPSNLQANVTGVSSLPSGYRINVGVFYYPFQKNIYPPIQSINYLTNFHSS